MYKIRDLVTIDEHARFLSDVQLSNYDDRPINQSLLRSYLFSATAPGDLRSAVDLLKSVIEGFSNPRLDNRMVAIANYGHGKSHLALVLANYFGKAYGSPELKIILEKIDKAIDNSAKAAQYHEFRENHSEFLVVRLRGDVPSSLHEQFVLGLERALKEHEATRTATIPFWYTAAEKFLESLSGQMLKAANAHLSVDSLDVPVLARHLRERRERAYDICRTLSAHLYGAPLDFGGQISLRELVGWSVDSFCGEGRPLGGMLVLCDEFSLYVQKYAQRSAVAGDLQDLLQGIEDKQGHAVFVAFAQLDPILVAREFMQSGQGLQSLERELTRIPRKVKLYSLMESVIDSYLTQPKEPWEKLRSDMRVRGPLGGASSLTMELFSRRYEDGLRWDAERFDEIVTTGCFPLHPLTTALLCSLNLQGVGAAGNPRTVLGFVFEQIDARKDKLALRSNNQLNWVRPVELVDYFEDYFPPTIRALYDNACRNLLPDAPEEQRLLLKALLLSDTARLPVRGDTQVDYFVQATGIERQQVVQHLKKLSNDNITRYDPTTRLNSFWPVSSSPARLEEIIRQHLQAVGMGPVDDALLDKLNHSVTMVPVSIDWGHSEDWAAKQVVLTTDHFEVNRLRSLCPPFEVTRTGELTDGVRGLVIWSLALNEEDVRWFRQNAAKVLDAAFPGDNPPPVVVILPAGPVHELVDRTRRSMALDLFSQDERKEVGPGIFDNEVTRTRVAVGEAWDTLTGGSQVSATMIRHPSGLVVPAPYRASFQALGERSLSTTLQRCYKLAYPYSPPDFQNQYHEGGRGPNRLRDAVNLVASALLRNSLNGNRPAVNANPIAKDMCSKVLARTWGLIKPDYRIQEPAAQGVAHAWGLLDEACKAGAKDVAIHPLVVQLFNPPYGYDSNTAKLLLAAWIGYYQHELRISLHGRASSLEKLSDVLTGRTPLVQPLVAEEVRLSRQDQSVVDRKIRALIGDATQKTFDQAEAEGIVAELHEYCENAGADSSLVESASNAANSLEKALQAAQTYDTQARKIRQVIEDEQDLDELLIEEKHIVDLPRADSVRWTEPSPDELRAAWSNRLRDVVETACAELETVERLTQIEHHQKRLDELKKQLKKASHTDLVKRVEQAQVVVKGRAEELTEESREAPTLAEIAGMQTRSDLVTLLVHQKRLKQMSGSSSVEKARKQKLAEIEAEISQLTTLVEQLAGAVDRLVSLKDVDEWRQRCLRVYDRFQETPQQKVLDRAQQRGEQLREFISVLESLAARTPISPEEADELLGEFETLRKKHGRHLTDAQLKLLDKESQRIEKYVERQVEQARKWLQEVEAQFERGRDFVNLRAKAGQLPAFVESAGRRRLEKLQQAIQAKIDEDTVLKIETLFRALADRKQRKSCLQRLEKLLNEEE